MPFQIENDFSSGYDRPDGLRYCSCLAFQDKQTSIFWNDWFVFDSSSSAFADVILRCSGYKSAIYTFSLIPVRAASTEKGMGIKTDDIFRKRRHAGKTPEFAAAGVAALRVQLNKSVVKPWLASAVSFALITFFFT
jgi:hypothetical protein